jgi:hypothetical protein
MFARAREQGEERAARWMRPPRAAIEPHRHIGAAERVLQQAEVTARGADEDCHLVERNTVPRFLQHAAGDLDAFSPFAWSRKELERSVGRA